MCGIWGLINRDLTVSAKNCGSIMNDLLCLSESRGKEAAGVAILSENKVNIIKRAQAASDMVKSKDYCEFLRQSFADIDSARYSAIGHSRLVTNGSALDSRNNQPVNTELVTTVHNGIIVNTEELWKKFTQLKRECAVDTEIFAKLCDYERQKELSVINSVVETYKKIQGMASTINFFNGDNCLVAATNNGSLYYCVSNNGKTVVLASEKLTLQRLIQKNKTAKGKFRVNNIIQIKANMGIAFNLTSLIMQNFSLDENIENTEALKMSKKEICIFKEENILTNTKINNCMLNTQQLSKYDIDVEQIKKIRRCKRCVLPETMPFIRFDEEGICNYCRTYEKMKYLGKDKLMNWALTQKKPNGQNDSIVSFSGGRDSSYGLHYFVKELGLKPVAFSYDWGMVTDLARRNQSRMCSKLGVELILVSADLKKKRGNIRKNVLAWLKKPDLGMVPLFMAGDKQYFYYANKVRKQYGLESVLMASNPFEKTHFKSGFCGVEPTVLKQSDKKLELEQLEMGSIIRMAGHYFKQYATNPRYINSSLIDTISATASYYIIPHNYFRLFNYISWDEREVNDVLINEYDWEMATDTESTWRIGDGTAPFYNYIYYLVCGFTENDTLRSNQIREGMIKREEALDLVYRDNAPRFESMGWYFDVIGLDMKMVLDVVQNMKKLY